MGDLHDPNRVAAIWQQAAVKVRGLVRDSPDSDGWNAAIGHASEVLDREAEAIRVMGRMAQLLITGNTEPPERKK